MKEYDQKVVKLLAKGKRKYEDTLDLLLSARDHVAKYCDTNPHENAAGVDGRTERQNFIADHDEPQIAKI